MWKTRIHNLAFSIRT